MRDLNDKDHSDEADKQRPGRPTQHQPQQGGVEAGQGLDRVADEQMG